MILVMKANKLVLILFLNLRMEKADYDFRDLLVKTDGKIMISDEY